MKLKGLSTSKRRKKGLLTSNSKGAKGARGVITTFFIISTFAMLCSKPKSEDATSNLVSDTISISEIVSEPVKPIELFKFSLVPNDDTIPYRAMTFIGNREMSDQSYLKGRTEVEIDSEKTTELRIFSSGFYSIRADITAKDESLIFPLIQEHVFNEGTFQRNRDGTLTFSRASLVTDFEGVIKMFGSCEVYGDDYSFYDVIINVTKGENIFSMTSSNSNQYDITQAYCKWRFSVQSVNGFDPRLRFN